MAANLTDAAHLSYARASVHWAAGNLKTQLAAFIAAIRPVFEDAIPNDRPVGNWIVLLQNTADQMDPGVTPETIFNTAVEQLYRICSAGAAQLAANLITAPKAAALLAAWNAQIGP
jgi:hypothetical protein